MTGNDRLRTSIENKGWKGTCLRDGELWMTLRWDDQKQTRALNGKGLGDEKDGEQIKTRPREEIVVSGE